jgi:hypothetical protein
MYVNKGKLWLSRTMPLNFYDTPMGKFYHTWLFDGIIQVIVFAKSNDRLQLRT